MAEKKNMFAGFAEAASQREREQENVESVVVTGQKKDTGRIKKRGAGATTITLSISSEDKEILKIAAAKRGASISDLLHQFAMKLQEEE